MTTIPTAGPLPAIDTPFVTSLFYQKSAALFGTDRKHFVWGLWMVGDECRGLSVRRGDPSPVTGNLSQFFPHRIEA